MQTEYPANSAQAVIELGDRSMPHRLVLLLDIIGVPVALISGVSAMVGLITADGLATMITVVGLAVILTLGRLTPVLLDFIVKMTPALADAFRQFGYAVADVRGRMKRELAEAKTEVREIRAAVSENKSGLRDLKASTDDIERKASAAVEIAKSEAAAEADRRIAAVRAEMEAGHKEQIAALNAQLEAYREEDHEKRHEIRDQLGTTSLRAQAIDAELQQARAEIADLKAQLAASDASKVEAINRTGESVQVIADRMRPPVKVEVPHLETIEPPTP